MLESSSENTTLSNGESGKQKEYKVLRALNWLLSALLIGGSVPLLVTTKEISPLIIGMLVFLLLILANYVGTALMLYSGLNTVIGIPILLNASNRAAIYALLLGNGILCLLGLGIVVSSLSTDQYGPSLSGFLYLFLSLANLRALWEIRRPQDYAR